MLRPAPSSTLFPYTTLFRSIAQVTPGPNVIIVTLIGYHVAGIGGALVTTVAMCGPACAFAVLDRKSTRLNSSHSQISYAVFCLKKKKVGHESPFSGVKMLSR